MKRESACFKASMVLIISLSFLPELLGQQHAPVKVSGAGLSSTFKSKAWRALDALNRMIGPYSEGHKDTSTDALLLDTKKAVDEAKYVAKTPRDLYVLHALEMATISFESQLSTPNGDPDWQKFVDREQQCQVEAAYYATPDQLSDKGKADALKGTCNKATEEWDAGITR